MKKLLLIVGLLVMAGPGWSDEKNTKAKLNEYKELASSVVEALEPIAQKIGQGAEAVWKMAVKSAWIDGIFQSIASGVAGTIFFCMIIMCIKAAREQEGEASFAFGLMSLIPLAVCIKALHPALHNLLNPEYMALKDLLEAVK